MHEYIYTYLSIYIHIYLSLYIYKYTVAGTLKNFAKIDP